MNAYQWISGIVFPATRLTAWNRQVSKARRTVNCCKAAEGGGYQVLLTVDQGIPRQQTMVGRKLAIILIRSRTNQMEDLLPLAPAIIKVLEFIQPGQSVLIPFSG
jgi:hypothetical protein